MKEHSSKLNLSAEEHQSLEKQIGLNIKNSRYGTTFANEELDLGHDLPEDSFYAENEYIETN